MSPAVLVENLAKRYRIQHESSGGRARYRTLREALVDAASWKRLVRRPRSRSSEDFFALQDVNFEIAPGEAVGIIGHNGAGKSTLLKILTRITEPSSGQATMRGRVASLLEVGTGFHPELTGRENIFLNGSLLGMSRAEIRAQFDSIVEFSGVEKFIDTPVKRYSSGMVVRLGFSVASNLTPEILLIDEVLAVGDATFQKKCLGRMEDVAESGRTILFVSHNMAAVRGLCSRVLWIDNGRLKMDGGASQVVDAYLQESLRDANGPIELCHVTRSSGAGVKLRIHGIELNEGQPLRHGEPLVATLQFEVLTDVHDVSFSIGFSTIDSVRLMTVDTDQDGSRRNLKAGQRCVVRMELDALWLAPARYLLTLGSRSGQDHHLDLVDCPSILNVFPGTETPSFMLRNSAGVRCPATWSWTAS